MTHTQLVKLNNQIKSWSGNADKKLVIGIDGYTGAGKTTLLNNLAKINPEILAVHRDDFQISRTKFQKLYRNVKHRPRLFELEMNDTKRLRKLIEKFRNSDKPYNVKTYDGTSGKVNIEKTFDLSKRIMVVEGVFLFHPKLLNKSLDKRIYLAGDTVKIDQRRIKREKRRWGKDYFPETHPDSYFRQVIMALHRYQKQYRPESRADLVIITTG